jgi:hypothetical protein
MVEKCCGLEDNYFPSKSTHIKISTAQKLPWQRIGLN